MGFLSSHGLKPAYFWRLLENVASTDTHLATDFVDLGAQLRLFNRKRDLPLRKPPYLDNMFSFSKK